MKTLPILAGTLAICSMACTGGNLLAADDLPSRREDVVYLRNVLEPAPAPVDELFEERLLPAPPTRVTLSFGGASGRDVLWQGRVMAQADQQGPGPQGPQGPRGPKGPPGGPPDADGFGGGGMFGGDVERMFMSMGAGPGRGMPHTVLLPSGGLDAAALGELDEDLPVMARVLDRAIERDAKSADTAMGISVMSLGMRPGQNLFIEGFGVVFERSVGFPLTPTQKQEPKEPRKPDTEWERARSEIFGNSREPGRGFGPQDPFNQGTPDYDAERVDRLKTQVLEALKNAANIRHLKPQETIAVVITGADTRGGFTRTLRTMPTRNPRAGAGGGAAGGVTADVTVQTQAVTGGGPDGPKGRPAPRPSALTIRVKKADVDAFAAGKLTVEEFKKKAFLQVN